MSKGFAFAWYALHKEMIATPPWGLLYPENYRGPKGVWEPCRCRDFTIPLNSHYHERKGPSSSIKICHNHSYCIYV